MNKRFQALVERLKKEDMDYLLVTDPASISYLTDKMIYPGERMLVLCVSAKGQHASTYLKHLILRKFGFLTQMIISKC